MGMCASPALSWPKKTAWTWPKTSRCRRSRFSRIDRAAQNRSGLLAAGIVRIVLGVAHPVGQFINHHVDLLTGIGGGDRLFHCAFHAEEPCVALGLPNLHVQVALAQARMTLRRGVMRRPAKPFAEVELQGCLGRTEIGSVQSANRGSFGEGIHPAIKGLDQLIDGLPTANQLIYG